MNDTMLAWKAHWPGFEDCTLEQPSHDMRLLHGQAWACVECHRWFDLDDSIAVAMYMAGAQRVLWATRWNGGSQYPVPAETF